MLIPLTDPNSFETFWVNSDHIESVHKDTHGNANAMVVMQSTLKYAVKEYPEYIVSLCNFIPSAPSA